MGTLHSTPETYGVIDASWMVGMLIGAWLAGFSVRPTTTDPTMARRLVVAAGLVCLAPIAVGSMVSPWWIVPCYLFGGTANSAINVLGATLLGRRVPPAARGRAGTAATMRLQGGSLLGFVLGGLLLNVGEPRWILLGCGAAGLVVSAIVFGVVNRVGGRTGGGTAADMPQGSPAVAVS
jgi:MFS family permease